MPNGIELVSPCTTSTAAKSTPSISATIWAKVVSWPWPWLWLPVKTDTDPVGCTRTLPDSYSPARAPSDPTTAEGAMPHASMKVEMPMPRSFPRPAASFRRASKPSQSAALSARSRVAS